MRCECFCGGVIFHRSHHSSMLNLCGKCTHEPDLHELSYGWKIAFIRHSSRWPCENGKTEFQRERVSVIRALPQTHFTFDYILGYYYSYRFANNTAAIQHIHTFYVCSVHSTSFEYKKTSHRPDGRKTVAQRLPSSSLPRSWASQAVRSVYVTGILSASAVVKYHARFEYMCSSRVRIRMVWPLSFLASKSTLHNQTQTHTHTHSFPHAGDMRLGIAFLGGEAVGMVRTGELGGTENCRRKEGRTDGRRRV